MNKSFVSSELNFMVRLFTFKRGNWKSFALLLEETRFDSEKVVSKAFYTLKIEAMGVVRMCREIF